MARHRNARLPQFFEQFFRVRPRRDTEQRLLDIEEYLKQLTTALEEVFRDYANTSNVNANSALIVSEGESLPTVGEDLIGRLILQRISATKSRLWMVADDAAGTPTYYEIALI